ncbi:hypothetical protein OHB53_28315 [Streptomyces sp. NBC_00056]|uniref:hypothetical protein n=1 Tax=Streptomyces sp. NBC_00063 TaxID=2975638 RepID=UPI0022562328|nr:hypothetical protein [Streptomyces sp. NBC_00063]MCX5437716.1 hypothetical protein [Streptomyces sp. NBC_00063]
MGRPVAGRPVREVGVLQTLAGLEHLGEASTVAGRFKDLHALGREVVGRLHIRLGRRPTGDEQRDVRVGGGLRVPCAGQVEDCAQWPGGAAAAAPRKSSGEGFVDAGFGLAVADSGA